MTTDGTEPSEESTQLTVDLASQTSVEANSNFHTIETLEFADDQSQAVVKFFATFVMIHTKISKNSLGQEQRRKVDLRVSSPVVTATVDFQTGTTEETVEPTDDSQSNGTPTPSATQTPTPQFVSGQAASIVIGQSNFTSNSTGYGAAGLNVPLGVALSSTGVLYISDSQSMRVVGFNSVPSSNGASSDFIIGQSPSGAAANKFDTPHGVAATASQLFVADTYNSRVQIFNSPTTNGASANFSIGQASVSSASSPGGASDSVIAAAYAVSVGGSKIAVADLSYNRVLLYNSIPTANSASAAVVLGQPNKTSSSSGSGAASMNYPEGVWTNGTKVIVSDRNNNRLMIWNSWPTSDGQTPDLTMTGFNQPAGVSSDGTQIALADEANNRVVIWSTWPTSSSQAPDIILGGGSNPSATSLDGPIDVAIDSTRVFVVDANNNRVLIFEKQ